MGSRPCAIAPAIKLSIESREGKKGEERRREYRDDENTKDERRKEEEPWRRGRPRATEKSCASRSELKQGRASEVEIKTEKGGEGKRRRGKGEGGR